MRVLQEKELLKKITKAISEICQKLKNDNNNVEETLQNLIKNLEIMENKNLMAKGNKKKKIDDRRNIIFIGRKENDK